MGLLLHGIHRLANAATEFGSGNRETLAVLPGLIILRSMAECTAEGISVDLGVFVAETEVQAVLAERESFESVASKLADFARQLEAGGRIGRDQAVRVEAKLALMSALWYWYTYVGLRTREGRPSAAARREFEAALESAWDELERSFRIYRDARLSPELCEARMQALRRQLATERQALDGGGATRGGARS
jgi:hypothetical protein